MEKLIMAYKFGAIFPTTNLEYFAVKLFSNSWLPFHLFKNI